MKKKYLLWFPKSETEKPLIYHLAKDYDIIFNIYRAQVTADNYGYIVLDLEGETENIEKGIAFLKSYNIGIDEADKGIRWNSSLCIQCGNCLSHCPTDALYVTDKKSRKVDYDIEKCIQCLSCIQNCPYGACSSILR